MAKTLASFAPAPVFNTTAEITVAGKGAQPLKLKCRFHAPKDIRELYRTHDSLQAKAKTEEGEELTDDQLEDLQKGRADLLLDMYAGWEFTDEFNEGNVLTFINTHTLAYFELVAAFHKAHTEAKVKN